METRTARKILVATDFSDGSDEALEQRDRGGEAGQAEVEILHVIELAEEFPFGTVYFDADYGALYANIDPAALAARRPVRAAGLPCATKILEGSAVHRDRRSRPRHRR